MTFTKCKYIIWVTKGKEGGVNLETIKGIRKSRNLMQKDVAKKLGIEVSYLYMIETGMRNPSDKLKHKICDLYGIDMNTLFLALELTKCK